MLCAAASTTLSMEEHKVMQSLERLDQKLKGLKGYIIQTLNGAEGNIAQLKGIIFQC